MSVSNPPTPPRLEDVEEYARLCGSPGGLDLIKAAHGYHTTRTELWNRCVTQGNSHQCATRVVARRSYGLRSEIVRSFRSFMPDEVLRMLRYTHPDHSLQQSESHGQNQD